MSAEPLYSTTIIAILTCTNAVDELAVIDIEILMPRFLSISF